MKAALTAVILAAGAFAGCTAPENPNVNLLAPKLVLDLTWQGDVQVFVHSAFGERMYDAIRLSVDNDTLEERNGTYSLETRLTTHAFYLEAEAESGRSRFAYRGVFNFTGVPDEPRVRVSAHVDGEWGEARACALPCEQYLSQEPNPDETS